MAGRNPAATDKKFGATLCAGVRVMTKIAWKALVALTALTGLGGCIPVALPERVPNDVDAYTRQSASIHSGETTRAEVHMMLGDPWRSSRYWQTDVHLFLAVQRTYTIWTGLAVFFPEATDVGWDGYVLVAYDDDDRVTAVDSGARATTRAYMMLRASDITFAKIPRKHAYELVLLASGPRLSDYLRLRPQAGNCKLIVACEPGAACPDRVAIDNTLAFDPSFVSLACDSGSACPHGARPRAAEDFALVPVLQPLILSAGEHRVVVGSSSMKGDTEGMVNCPAGETRYARIQGDVSPERGLQATIVVVDNMPDGWSDYSIVIWRSGSVVHHMDAPPTLD
jgi:hypothetical protein